MYEVILWGYPRGMRGNHFSDLVRQMDLLESHLNVLRNSGNQISDWGSHWAKHFSNAGSGAKLMGLGLSTYSKYLYFLKTRVNGRRCLILDNVLIEVFKRRKFEEFASLQKISYFSAPKYYVQYLDLMESASAKLDVEMDQLEMFLFMFGPILT